jgi:hypothetical protein
MEVHIGLFVETDFEFAKIRMNILSRSELLVHLGTSKKGNLSQLRMHSKYDKR